MKLSNIIALINILIENNKTRFSIISLNRDMISVTFEDLKTNKIYKQKLSEILARKNVLRRFSSSDACKLGYANGKNLAYRWSEESENSKSINNDISIFDNKATC